MKRAKGQITLPKSIRQALGADTGSKLAFEPRGGEVVFRDDSKAKVIVYAWVNDEQTLRSSGSKGSTSTTARCQR